MRPTDPLTHEGLALPLWAQVSLAAWSFGVVVIFVRQMLVAYTAALTGG